MKIQNPFITLKNRLKQITLKLFKRSKTNYRILTLIYNLFISAMVIVALPATAALPNIIDGQPLPSLAPMVKKVTPAVVNISTIGSIRENNPLMDDPFFQHFFGYPRSQRERRTESLGSGVIVDANNGYILTNHHVIEHAAKITVTLNDGRSFFARVVGTDSRSDVAVIQIKSENLTEMRLADSSKVEVGDFVVAIGNPFGLGQTVTSGIVSALGRTGLGIEEIEDFIQTDASINPGNSGGALVNLKGELVGLNTAIVAPSGGNVGIGFAIPSNMAIALKDELINHGKVVRPTFGIAVQDLTPQLAQAFNTTEVSGALIRRVLRNSLADDAGLIPGDIIIAVDNRQIKDANHLLKVLGLIKARQMVEMVISRDGRRYRVNIDM